MVENVGYLFEEGLGGGGGEEVGVGYLDVVIVGSWGVVVEGVGYCWEGGGDDCCVDGGDEGEEVEDEEDELDVEGVGEFVCFFDYCGGGFFGGVVVGGGLEEGVWVGGGGCWV